MGCTGQFQHVPVLGISERAPTVAAPYVAVTFSWHIAKAPSLTAAYDLRNGASHSRHFLGRVLGDHQPTYLLLATNANSASTLKLALVSTA